MSIHKSQGMTIDYLSIDLTGVFEYGMTYVALSRGVSCEHMGVKGFQMKEVKTNPKVLAFDEAVRRGEKYVSREEYPQSGQSQPTHPLQSNHVPTRSTTSNHIQSHSIQPRPVQSHSSQFNLIQTRPTLPLTNSIQSSHSNQIPQLHSLSIQSPCSNPVLQPRSQSIQYPNQVPQFQPRLIQSTRSIPPPVPYPHQPHSTPYPHQPHSTPYSHPNQHNKLPPTSLRPLPSIQQPVTDHSFDTSSLFNSKPKSSKKKDNSLANLASGLQSLNKSFMYIIC